MEEVTPMARSTWLSILVLVVVASGGRAVIFLTIHDPVDDHILVDAVSGQKPVRALAAEIEALEKNLLANDKGKIEKLLGKSAAKPRGDYAMPLGQCRSYMISGLNFGAKEDKRHTAYYPVGDFAGIEVSYGFDGKSPQYAVLYFKVDDDFPKLKKVEEKPGDKPAGPKKAAPTRKHTIDMDHWNKMTEEMNKAQVAELFSVSAGDYAPGTEYLTRTWGWRRGSGGEVKETLEWRGEKGRIIVEFDEKGNYVTCEFYFPGRDPATNVADRLKWDREKFAKVKKYVEERMAAK
jgi:hypothetical protein